MAQLVTCSLQSGTATVPATWPLPPGDKAVCETVGSARPLGSMNLLDDDDGITTITPNTMPPGCSDWALLRELVPGCA